MVKLRLFPLHWGDAFLSKLLDSGQWFVMVGDAFLTIY